MKKHDLGKIFGVDSPLAKAATQMTQKANNLIGKLNTGTPAKNPALPDMKKILAKKSPVAKKSKKPKIEIVQVTKSEKPGALVIKHPLHSNPNVKHPIHHPHIPIPPPTNKLQVKKSTPNKLRNCKKGDIPCAMFNARLLKKLKKKKAELPKVSGPVPAIGSLLPIGVELKPAEKKLLLKLMKSNPDLFKQFGKQGLKIPASFILSLLKLTPKEIEDKLKALAKDNYLVIKRNKEKKILCEKNAKEESKKDPTLFPVTLRKVKKSSNGQNKHSHNAYIHE